VRDRDERESRRAADREKRSGSRRRAGMIAGAVVAIAAIVLLVTSLGGSSHPKAATSTTNGGTTTTTTGTTHHKTHHASTPKSAAVASPAETSVAVLNGTETTGLAHRISGELQQGGYTQATPLNGRPPGSNQQTVVQYASGHKGEAEAIAHSLGVSQVQPLESSVATLSGASSVVVIVGADKAAG
jgi:hypothetical protein